MIGYQLDFRPVAPDLPAEIECQATPTSSQGYFPAHREDGNQDLTREDQIEADQVGIESKVGNGEYPNIGAVEGTMGMDSMGNVTGITAPRAMIFRRDNCADVAARSSMPWHA